MTATNERLIDYYCAFCLLRKEHTAAQHRRSIREREAFMAGRVRSSYCHGERARTRFEPTRGR